MNKLRIMAKLPIYVDKIAVYSPTLLEIANLGQDGYGKIINNCLITKESVVEEIKKYTENMLNYDVLLFIIYNYFDFLNQFLDSLYCFTKERLYIASSIETRDVVFTNGKAELNRDNYDNFVNAIKYVNCMPVENEEELDEFDKLLLEREKKVKEAFNKNNEHVNLEDLISAVVNIEGNGLNILNIWELNIYQFYEQMQRGQMKEQYDLAIKQLLAGAKAEDIEVKYYFANIE